MQYPVFLYSEQQVHLVAESELELLGRVDDEARIASASGVKIQVPQTRKGEVSAWDKSLLHSFYAALMAGGVSDRDVIGRCIAHFSATHDIPPSYVTMFCRDKLRS